MMVRAIGREDTPQIFKEKDVIKSLSTAFDLGPCLLVCFHFLRSCDSLRFPVFEDLWSLILARVVEVAVLIVRLNASCVFAGLVA